MSGLDVFCQSTKTANNSLNVEFSLTSQLIFPTLEWQLPVKSDLVNVALLCLAHPRNQFPTH